MPNPKKKKLSTEQFVYLAIEKLRDPRYAGIHTVYSGFNTAFRKYFDGMDPVKETAKLQEQGKIFIRPVRGGVIIYKDAEVPEHLRKFKQEDRSGEVLEKMGLTSQ
jgi:hypothetical protein